MKLTILGSGTCKPHPKRKSPGCVLSINREDILIDMGCGTFNNFHKAGFDYKKINYIFITHIHPDHVSDLIAYLQLYYVDTLHNINRKTLNIIGPRGFKKFYKKYLSAFGLLKKIKFVKVHEMGEVSKEFSFGKVNVKYLKHNLNMNTAAYRFETKNKSAVIAGDTGPCKNIVNLSKDVNLLLIEAALPTKFDGHLTPGQAGEIGNKANVKKLVLTHFYPEVEKINIKKEAAKNYKGKIVLAEDLMQIKI